MGRRELTSSHPRSLGGTVLVGPWSQHHHHLLVPGTILASAERKETLSPRRTHRPVPTRAHPSSLMTASGIHLKGRRRMDACLLSSHSAKQVHRAVTAPGPTSEGVSQWLEYPLSAQTALRGFHTCPPPLNRTFAHPASVFFSVRRELWTLAHEMMLRTRLLRQSLLQKRRLLSPLRANPAQPEAAQAAFFLRHP